MFDTFVNVWIRFDKFGNVWIRSDTIGNICIHLDTSVSIWIRLDTFGCTCNHAVDPQDLGAANWRAFSPCAVCHLNELPGKDSLRQVLSHG